MYFVCVEASTNQVKRIRERRKTIDSEIMCVKRATRAKDKSSSKRSQADGVATWGVEAKSAPAPCASTPHRDSHFEPSSVTHSVALYNMVFKPHNSRII